MARTSLDPDRASPARPFPRQLRFATASSAAQTPGGPALEDETQRWSWRGKGRSFARVPSLDTGLSAIYAAENHLSGVPASFPPRRPRRYALPRLLRRRFAIANAIEADPGRDQQPPGPENRHLTGNCPQGGPGTRPSSPAASSSLAACFEFCSSEYTSATAKDGKEFCESPISRTAGSRQLSEG
jgi:hypothetical protein